LAKVRATDAESPPPTPTMRAVRYGVSVMGTSAPAVGHREADMNGQEVQASSV
jgi:hypothetical protein